MAMTMPAWHVGYATAPAQGFGPGPMRLVSGKAPAGLTGTLYRNGPAHFKHGEAYATHWFDGDGMVQRINILDGKAVHTGRFIDTPKRRREMAVDKFLAPGFGTVGDPSYPVASSNDVNPGNISVMMSGGELLALWEAGTPYRLDPVTLETKGLKVWREDLAGMPFLAHPKREPNGRVWSLAIAGRRVGIYKIAPDGATEEFAMVDIGAAHYIHDWTMTERKLVILCQPWIQTKNTPPFIDGFQWKPEQGMKFLVDRQGRPQENPLGAGSRARLLPYGRSLGGKRRHDPPRCCFLSRTRAWLRRRRPGNPRQVLGRQRLLETDAGRDPAFG